MPTPEPTIRDVIEVLQGFSERMDQWFDAVEKGLDRHDGRFNDIDTRFDRLEGRVGAIEDSMVTKDYLDEKLHDLRGDLVILVRKEDRKLGALVDALVERHVLDSQTGARILSLEPFAHS